MKRKTLFSTRQFGGLKSAQDPLALAPGDASDATNLRKEPGGPIKVRNGVSTAVAAATGLAAGTFKGASSYNDGAVVHWVIAWKHTSGGAVHLYHRTYTIATTTWSSWVQVTATSGKYGDTSLADPTNGRIAIWWGEVPAGDQTTTGKDYHTFKDAPFFCASDGAKTVTGDLDVIVNGAELGDASKLVARAKAIQPPDKGSVEFSEYIAAEMSSAATPTGSGAGDWGTVNDTNSTWVFTTAAGAGTPAVLTGADTADISFDSHEVQYATYTSDENFFMPRHFCLIAHASTGLDFWENCDFAFAWKPVGSGNPYAFKYFDTAPLVLPTNVANYEMIVFKMPDQLPDQADELEFNGLQLRTRVTTPVSCTVTIYSMFFGGVVPGGTEYGICRRNRGNHVVSPGVVCGDTTFGTKNASTRGVNEGVLDAVDRDQFNAISSSTLRLKSRALPAGFILPIDSRVCYTPKVRFSEPHQGDLDDNGADYVQIYRKEPGESDFYRVDRVALGFYATTWQYGTPASGTAASATYTYTDTVQPGYREYKDRLPDESCAPPPPLFSGAQFGPRAITLERSTYGTEVKLSEHGQPLRYSNSVTVSDDAKGAFNIKVVGELGRALGQSSFLGGNAESSQAIVFTDEGAWAPYRMQGDVVLYDLRRVNEHGSCTFSVSEGDGYVCYLDKNRDLRVLGGDGSLSRYLVSDKLNAIPDAYIGITDIAFWKGRIYVAYTPSGQTENKQVLVYNFDGEYWECYDTFPSAKEPQQFFNWRVSGTNLLYFIASDGAIYEYEKASQLTDAGTNIAFLIESGEFHNDDFGLVRAESMGVIGTDAASITLNTTRTRSDTSATDVGTINLDVADTRSWKLDLHSGKSGIPGIEGPGVKFKFDGSFNVACSFYAMVADMEGVDEGGPTRG